MAAKDYKLCVSGIMGTVYIYKVSKTNPHLMLNDRRQVLDNEIIPVILHWANAQLKPEEDTLSITAGDKVVAEIKFLDKKSI